MTPTINIRYNIKKFAEVNMDKNSLLKDLGVIRIRLRELDDYLPFVYQKQMIDNIDIIVNKVIEDIKKHEKKKFRNDDIRSMVWNYQLSGRSIKKTLHKLECEGIHISDKQLRNILEKEGIYKKKK